jgi:hypothetical protein
LRQASAKRVSDGALSAGIREAESLRAERMRKIQAETNSQALAETALNAGFDDVCLAAVRRLADQEALARVAMKTPDRNVAKEALARLKESRPLEQVAGGAADKAVRLAAEAKLGTVAWRDAFAWAAGPKAGPQALGDALAAVSLSPNPEGIGRLVTDACLRLIRRGDESRIPELAELLQAYGDKLLCEDYLNCGQPDLGKAGREWARKRGYNIGSGHGSNRARWGSERGR